MVEDEKKPFSEALFAMASTYRVEVTPAMALGYWLGLEDLDLADIRTAVVKGMRECEFMPTVAVLRKFAKSAQLVPAAYWIEPAKPAPWTPEQIAEAEELRRRLGAPPEYDRRLPREREDE